MFKSIFRILTIGIAGLIVFAILRPTLSENLLDNAIESFKKSDGISILSSNSSSSTASNIKDNNSIDGNSLTIENVIDATNKERINAGLDPLKVNTKLTASAKIKTEDMITNQYFEHVSPTGVSVSDLGKKVGYNYILMGENLAMGDFSDTDDLVQAWMNSPGHRANILNTKYQEIGIYLIKGNYQGKNVWFAVQHFGTARGVCPSIDQDLKVDIDQLNLDLKKREADIEIIRKSLESPDRPKGKVYTDTIAYFNTLITQYNEVLAKSQQEVADYNLQVRAFNDCLGGYQTK